LAIAAAGLVAAILAAWWWHGGAVVEDSLATEVPREWSMLNEREAGTDDQAHAATARHVSVSLTEISVDVQISVLAAEDIGFFGHGPIDLDETWVALQDWGHGGRLRGASTISQQLAKNLYLSETRSYWRKLNELRLAWWLERKLSKGRIFELYLNVIELGEGIYGVEAAAHVYFGVSAGQVGTDQALDLAATIPSPRRDNPITRTKIFQIRRAAVAGRLPGAAPLRAWLMKKGLALPGAIAPPESELAAPAGETQAPPDDGADESEKPDSGTL